jgi:chitodextrinase
VTFTAHVDAVTDSVSSYTAVSTPGGLTGSLAGSDSGTIQVDGLIPFTDYTFRVYANNPVGVGSYSDYSGSIKTWTVPDAPVVTSSTVTSSSTVDVAFDAPAFNGGTPITSYTAVSVPEGLSGSVTQEGGGVITVSGVTPNTSYTFKVYATNSVGNSAESNESGSIFIPQYTVDYLVVAGGGGGGHGNNGGGGGGGAGGVLNSTGLVMDYKTSYVITVGAGGSVDGNGSGSSLDTYIATIGGGAGGQNSNGISGGSGGGGGRDNGGSGGAGTDGQGMPGAPCYYGGSSGGGGGWKERGYDGLYGYFVSPGGAGGAGGDATIAGEVYAVGGGGGGGCNHAADLGGAGGYGGGGTGGGDPAQTPSTAGAPNTGGGGGGSAPSTSGHTNPQPGGSGLVIVAYPGAAKFTGGDQYEANGYTVHKFLSSGTLTPLPL